MPSIWSLFIQYTCTKGRKCTEDLTRLQCDANFACTQHDIIMHSMLHVPAGASANATLSQLLHDLCFTVSEMLSACCRHGNFTLGYIPKRQCIKPSHHTLSAGQPSSQSLHHSIPSGLSYFYCLVFSNVTGSYGTDYLLRARKPPIPSPLSCVHQVVSTKSCLPSCVHQVVSTGLLNLSRLSCY